MRIFKPNWNTLNITFFTEKWILWKFVCKERGRIKRLISQEFLDYAYMRQLSERYDTRA